MLRKVTHCAGRVSADTSMHVIHVFTRSTHAYDASRRSKRHVQVGRAAKVSGVFRLVGVQRTVQNKSNVKSEPKYLACEESPICTFYC